MAVASAPRPSNSRKVFFDDNEALSYEAKKLYDSWDIIWNLEDSHFTKSDALHIIVAVFQNQPLSLKYLAMKKVLQYDLEVKDLPVVLQVQADKVGYEYNCKN